MNITKSQPGEIVTYSLTGVLVAMLKGAPLYWNNDRIPWKSVNVPSFPVTFSILSGVFAGAPNVFIAIGRLQTLGHKLTFVNLIIGFTTTSIVYAALLVMLNFVIMLWLRHVLQRTGQYPDKGYEQSLRPAVRRVSYFSTAFQPLLCFVCVGCIVLTGHYDLSGRLIRIMWPIMAILGLLRLLAVFQSVRYETEGSVSAGMLASIACLDVWIIFASVAWFYILTQVPQVIAIM